MSKVPKRFRDLAYSFGGVAVLLSEQFPSDGPGGLHWPTIEDLRGLLEHPECTSATAHALRFLLDLWDGSGDFRLREAFSTWSEQERWIFALWMTGQDVQRPGRPAPWIPIDTPPWIPRTHKTPEA